MKNIMLILLAIVFIQGAASLQLIYADEYLTECEEANRAADHREKVLCEAAAEYCSTPNSDYDICVLGFEVCAAAETDALEDQCRKEDILDVNANGFREVQF